MHFDFEPFLMCLFRFSNLPDVVIPSSHSFSSDDKILQDNLSTYRNLSLRWLRRLPQTLLHTWHIFVQFIAHDANYLPSSRRWRWKKKTQWRHFAIFFMMNTSTLIVNVFVSTIAIINIFVADVLLVISFLCSFLSFLLTWSCADQMKQLLSKLEEKKWEKNINK